jgi:hypothetical protein
MIVIPHLGERLNFLAKKNGEPLGSPFRNAVEEKRFTNTAARRI